MSKTYDNFTSSAIKSIEIVDNQVKIVYNSNIDKEYTFNCDKVEEFQQELSSILIELELGHTKYSIGSFIHQQIKSGLLIESK